MSKGWKQYKFQQRTHILKIIIHQPQYQNSIIHLSSSVNSLGIQICEVLLKSRYFGLRYRRRTKKNDIMGFLPNNWSRHILFVKLSQLQMLTFCNWTSAWASLQTPKNVLKRWNQYHHQILCIKYPTSIYNMSKSDLWLYIVTLCSDPELRLVGRYDTQYKNTQYLPTWRLAPPGRCHFQENNKPKPNRYQWNGNHRNQMPNQFLFCRKIPIFNQILTRVFSKCR